MRLSATAVVVFLLASPIFAQPADKNSPAAYGQRMQYRLHDLIDDPYSYIPSYADRYRTLLQYSNPLTPHQAYAMTMLLGPDSSRGYAKIPNTFALTFPDAHKVDLTEQVGWYYFAGTAHGKDGVDYGVLLMMFQFTMLPPPIAEHFGLTPLENQTVDVQLAITKKGGRMHQAAPPFFAGTTGEIEVGDRLFVRAGNNVVDTPSKDKLFPMTLRASGVDRGGASPVKVGLDITLVSGKGIILQGADGCLPCIGGVGTRYYSIPNLMIDPARSKITIGDSVVELESGSFWMDHQWGTGMIPAGSAAYPALRAAGNLAAPSTPGWDFFVANFDDGSAITLNHLHTAEDKAWLNQSGPNPPPDYRDRAVVGKYIDPLATVFNVWGSVTIDRWARGVTSPDPKIYPVSNVWFPHAWTFQLCGDILPASLRKIRFEAISDDSTAMYFANTAQYVEAPVNVIDANGTRRGSGFGEAVGYEDFTPSVAALAGLPPDVAKQMKPIPPSAGLKIRSFFYVATHKQELNAIFACAGLPPAGKPCACQ
jgi:predicted secreted hydrolase